jgi:hypothetical protein
LTSNFVEYWIFQTFFGVWSVKWVDLNKTLENFDKIFV